MIGPDRPPDKTAASYVHPGTFAGTVVLAVAAPVSDKLSRYTGACVGVVDVVLVLLAVSHH